MGPFELGPVVHGGVSAECQTNPALLRRHCSVLTGSFLYVHQGGLSALSVSSQLAHPAEPAARLLPQQADVKIVLFVTHFLRIITTATICKLSPANRRRRSIHLESRRKVTSLKSNSMHHFLILLFICREAHFAPLTLTLNPTSRETLVFLSCTSITQRIPQNLGSAINKKTIMETSKFKKTQMSLKKCFFCIYALPFVTYMVYVISSLQIKIQHYPCRKETTFFFNK